MYKRRWQVVLGGAMTIAVLMGVAVSRTYRVSQEKFFPTSLQASCGSGTQKLTTELSSSVLLNHEVLGHSPTAKEIEAAVEEQVAYMRGLFFNSFKSRGIEIAFTNTWSDLKLGSLRSVRYGSEVTIDAPKSDLEIPPKEYVESAKKRGFTHFDDPASVVNFTVTLEAVGCARDHAKIESSYFMKLPHDAFLGYWSVPAERRVRRVWHSSSAIVNPCGINELADLPSPEYFWYFFDPTAQGCQASLPKDSLVDARLRVIGRTELNSIVQFDREALDQLKEVKIGLVFGYIVHNESYAKPLDVRRAIESDVSSVDPEVAKWDTSSRQFFWFLNRISDVAFISSKNVETTHDSLIVTIRGRFKKSERPYVLRAFLGPTDLYGPVTPTHWQQTLTSMMSDDVFIYAGHSGLGENLRIARIQDRPLALDAWFKPSPAYQILAYLSCYSYTYFDQGNLPTAPFGSGRTRADLLLTAGETIQFGRASLGVISALASALSNSGRADLSKAFPSDDFVLHRTFKSSIHASAR
ncbi:hypothetical protein BH10BDE1_BH10BDE1_22930 [soil metagenome]